MESSYKENALLLVNAVDLFGSERGRKEEGKREKNKGKERKKIEKDQKRKRKRNKETKI